MRESILHSNDGGLSYHYCDPGACETDKGAEVGDTPGESDGTSAFAALMAEASRCYVHYSKNRDLLVKAYLEGGIALLEARKLAAHGQWLPLLAEFEIPQQTAHRMMRLAEHYGADADAVIKAGGIRRAYDESSKLPTVGNLDDDVSEHLTQSDSILPASPTASEEMAEALDELEEENYGLRQEIAELKDDGRHPLEDDPIPTPKPPTKAERLEAELQEARQEIERLAQERDQLQERVRFLEGERSEWPHEREAYFNRALAIETALRSELATERGSHNELKRAHQGALRRIRELEKVALAATEPAISDDSPLPFTSEEGDWVREEESP